MCVYGSYICREHLVVLTKWMVVVVVVIPLTAAVKHILAHILVVLF